MAKKKIKENVYMFLDEYLTSDDSPLVSVIKNVPLNLLEEVRSKLIQVKQDTEEEIGRKIKLRYRFRGPRYFSPYHTLKFEAKAFDVYVDVMNLPKKKNKKTKLIQDDARNTFKDNVFSVCPVFTR